MPTQNSPASGTPRRLTLAAGALWLGVVCWLTLRSNPALKEIILTTPWYCVVCGEGGTTDVLLNLLLFAPFGLVAFLLGWPLRRLLPWAFALTLSIELIQGTLLVGRDATLGDVLSNTSGAVIGWLMLSWVGAVIHTLRRARVASIAVLGCQALVWLGTGFGMRPALNGPAPWVGRFGNFSASLAPFEGSIQSVTLDGVPVTMDPLARLPGPRDSLALGMVLTRTSPNPPPRASSIVRLVDGRPKAFLRVYQVRTGLDLEVQMPASSLRFRTPSWRFPSAMAIPTGIPWRFEWRWHRSSVELTSGPASDTIPTTRKVIPLSIGLGWSLVHPFVWAISDNATRWTALWLVAWFALLGWTAAMVGRRFAAGMAAAGVAVFVGSGWWTALPVSPADLCWVTAGLIAGWIISRTTTPRPVRPGGA